MTLEEKIAKTLAFAGRCEHDTCKDEDHYWDCLNEANRAVALRQASAVSSLCVGVKLEWEYIAETVDTYEMWQATTPFGVATIVNGEESARLVGFGPVKDFDTVDAAKADLASRIISCLNIRTEEEVRAEASYPFQLLICGGEDAPGHATTLTVEEAERILREREDAARAEGAREERERFYAALANTPGWRDIDEKAKKLKRVDLCGYYPSTKHGPRLKRIPDCYWHKNAGVWRCDHYDRDGFRQLRANFVITHYREIDALPQPPEMK